LRLQKKHLTESGDGREVQRGDGERMKGRRKVQKRERLQDFGLIEK